MLSFLRSSRILANLQRCNHLNRTKPYSVAEHSYFCAIMAAVLCDYENKLYRDSAPDDPATQHSIAVRRDKVIFRLLLHDTPEILTGDILYPVKHFNDRVRVNLEKMELELVDKKLFADLELDNIEDYKEAVIYAKDNTPEGRMVAAIDKLEIMLFALEEFEMGNRAFTPLMDTAMEILKKNHWFGLHSVRRLASQIQNAITTIMMRQPRSSSSPHYSQTCHDHSISR